MKSEYALDKTGLSPVPKKNTKDKVNKRNFKADTKEGGFALGPDRSRGLITKSKGKSNALMADVNLSGKAGAQIPQLPLGDDSSPWGDNAVCT
jgi:hypothetical protein